MNFDTGNTGFMLLATSLVMLMTPGLAFFYGGLVGRQNVLSIMIQSFVSMGVTTILWYVCGYSLCFSGGEGGVIGNLDLALKQFTDYVAWFGDTDAAADATYYIGDIYYNQQVYDQALTSFDAVLERFPKGRRTLDAQYMKGRTLVKLNRRDEGAEEFRQIIRSAPTSPQATRSKSELRDLGLSAPAAAPPKRKK